MWSLPPPAHEDLRRHYGIEVGSLVSHEGGFEADCWIADDK